MKRPALVIALVAASCLTGVASRAAHAASTNAPPCTPKITTIQGHRAAVNCGPATATLRIGGKTYVFRNGFCQQSKAAANALVLNLGTTVIGLKGNAGRADISMTIDPHLHSIYGSGSVFGADYGGKDILGGDSLISYRGAFPSKGTFTSKVTVGAKFTGSWNCNGVVYHAP